MIFRIRFHGHPNIRSLHQKTIEITKEPEVTVRGDCIIGVGASASCSDLPDGLKQRIRDPESVIRIEIAVGRHSFAVTGRGHPDLTLEDAGDIVIRKSRFVSPRTMAVSCDGASDSLPREMVRALQDPKATGTFSIIVQ